MKKLILLLAVVGLANTTIYAQVAMEQNGDIVTLKNEKISASFNTRNADVTAIISKGKSLLGSKGRAYLLGPGFSMWPSKFTVVRSTKDLVELSFYTEQKNHFQYDLHYILRSGDAGLYCFLVQSHKAGDSVGNYGQTRWGVKADQKLFDYHLVRDSIQGPMPQMDDLKDGVQDWTYRLADSSYYTKYDYADYIEGRHVHGMAGQTSGLGLFTIQASHEYLDGGPTKQYQDVHSTPFLINMFNCGHFLSDIRKADDKIEGEWKKLNGPFFIYVNEGKNKEEVWKDAKKKAAEEVAKWPYQWMQHALYPLLRGTVNGSLMVDGKKARQGTHIILAAPGYDWQAQTQGYIFYTFTDANGNFELKNVRQGNYTLYAFGSNQTEEFTKADVSVITSKTTALQLDWKPIKHGDKIWQLGEADRRTKGFNLADSKRNYEVFLKVPANVDYTIGKSIESKDWYYAQAKDGSWNIHFDMPKEYKGEATLTLAMAGAARNPNLEVYVNDTKLPALPKLGNDASIYRSAIAGGYYQKHELKFVASLLKKTGNVISFKLVRPKLGSGVMYDAVKLEVE